MRGSIALALASLVLVVVLQGLLGCSGGNMPTPAETVTIRLGTLPLETATLIFVAEDQGLFAQHGLQVDVSYYDTGLGALNGMLAGEVDLAAPVGEYAVVGKVLAQEDVRIVAAIDKVDYQTIVARRDRGIKGAADLRGKRVGVIPNTQQEFYLTRFLELRGIRIGEVDRVAITLAGSVEAVVSGAVDAVLLVPPYSGTAEAQLGSNAIVWPAQDHQLTQQLIVCRGEWIGQNQEVLERFLRALSAAQDYLVREPASAQAIVQERLSLTEQDIARIWEQNQFSLLLDQSLVLAMEDETRWMIANGLTSAEQVPDYLDYIREDALRAVRPGVVLIIR